MRYLFLALNMMAIIMMVIGYFMYQSYPYDTAGWSIFDKFSIANLNASNPICVQQYVSLNESRKIDCDIGHGLISKLYSSGIVSTT